ncbi:MAG: hypothetical protein K0S11_571 [Gammaproteobacteria bacterium]|jgi:hypothetical protein|nr:hypothetical protein [Gammaproteobacteria bacterium]
MSYITIPAKFTMTKLWAPIILIFVLALAGCVSVPPQPKNINNACHIFSQYPRWYRNAKKVERRWGVPVSTQLAIMHQESSFIGRAKPSRQRLLWVVPWERPSSSYGYAQALHSTWKDYQRDTGNHSADRDSFDDSADFIGWYLRKINLQTGIPLNNVYALYLAYHDGPRGYLQGTYRRKAWLINVAKRVQSRTREYENQLKYCSKL